MKACYIHVPFCNKICAYCDFVRCGYQKELADKWLKRVEMDIRNSLKPYLETIYIGGGTPTALQEDQLEKLLLAIEPYIGNVKEYTIEANPDSLYENKLEILKNYGVNRISLGVQTFDCGLQDIIHRKHTFLEIQQLISLIKQRKINNISIDLMYGLPTQTLDMWKKDLELAVQLNVEHISLYSLTIEEHSQFGREKVKNVDPQLETEMYEYAIYFLNQQKFQQYEISNFAKAGYESKHNQVYWNYEDFIGIGCGASGKEDHYRYDNTHNLHTYIQQGASPLMTTLSKKDEMFEFAMMGLRKKRGISIKEFYRIFHIDFLSVFKEAIHKNIELQYLKISQGHVYTTYEGMLLLNTVLVDFL